MRIETALRGLGAFALSAALGQTVAGCSGGSGGSGELGSTASAMTGVVDKLFGRKPAAAVMDVAERVGQLEGARTRSARTAITPSGTGPSTFAIAGAPAIIDPAIDVTSPVTLSGCTVGIGVGFTSGDELDVDLTGVSGVTKSYDAARGTLTLTGSKDAATYQALFRTVTFRGTSGTSGKRTFTFGLGPAVANPDNNHFYEYVASSGTWEQAKVHAAARSYFGLQGYLATITSTNETDFIKSKLTSDGWIGAKASPENSLPRTWFWNVGPEAGTAFCDHNSGSTCVLRSGQYANWASGEPNNSGGEGCGQVYFGNLGRWNDLPCNATVLGGYVVEYGGMAGDPPLSDFTANVTAVYGSVSTSILLGGAGPSSFISGATAAAIDPGITVSSGLTLGGATVGIGAGHVSSDALDVDLTGHAGITKHYDATRGTLTITGSGSAATYQAILRAVTFRGTSVTSGTRTFTFGLGTAVANRANDHFYEYVAYSGTWDAARTHASARSYLGLQGYLVTLTSAAENDFVKAKLTDNGWIGARANTTSWSGRYWYWDAGPESGTQICTNTSTGVCSSIGGAYSNFASGEPNNAGGEDRGQMYVAGGTWNDLPPSGTQNGYLAEYGGMAGDPVVVLNASVTKSYTHPIADGQTGCTAQTGATLCQSGVCSADGTTCRPASGCWVDADCTNGDICSPVLKVCVKKVSQALTAATDTGFSQADGVTHNAQPTVRLVLTGTGAIAGHVVKVTHVGAVVGQATLTATDITNGHVDVPLTSALPESGAGGITALGVRWADLTAQGTNGSLHTASGTISTTLGPVTFTLTNTVPFDTVQTTGGTNYWASPYNTPYVSSGVTQPPTSDIIRFNLAGTRTATFSEPVEGLYFAIVSLNGNGLEFDRDFDIVSQTTVAAGGQGTPGCGYYGCGLFTKSLVTHSDGTPRYRLNGASGEPHGVIRFKGVFATVSWVALSNEYWNGANFGIGATSAELRTLSGGLYTAGGSLVSPSDLATVSVDATAPVAPTTPALAAADDTGTSSSDYLTSKTTGLTFTTTVEAGCYVTLFNDANANGAVDTGEALETDVHSPTATFSTDLALANGVHKIRAFCTDLAGNVGAVSAIRTVTIGPVPGAPVIAGFSPDSGTLGDGVTSARTLTLTGTALAGSTVTVRNGATTLGTATATAGGTWSFTTAQLAFGAHAFTAIATGVDLSPSPASAALEVVVQAPAGQGSCTVANQAIMCFSGTCNPTTNTCALPPGSPCTTGAQCVNGYCGVNGECGLADGQSGCTAQTGPTVCQSGVCSSDGVHCKPTTGCYGNGDCAAGEQCNLATLACELAPAVTASAGDSNFEAGGAAVRVDPALTVVGAPTLPGATVTISGAFVAAQDRLNFAPVNGITGSYNQTTGVLTLTGTASTAAYQGALRSVTYSNTAGNTPNTAQRTVTFGLGSAVGYAANGHFYEVVASNGTWAAAKTAAEGRTYLGLRGYLATITSPEENAYVFAKLAGDGWIGMQANSGTFPRTWSWVTGPEAGTPFHYNTGVAAGSAVNGGYFNWGPNQPDAAGGENVGQFYAGGGGKWNDLPSTYALGAYVVEYGGMAGDPQTVLTATKKINLRAKSTITVATSSQTSTFGNAVTLTATLAPTTVTGAVQFKDNGANLGAPVAVASGVAALSTSALTVGNHTITAVYAGDATHQPVTGALSTYQTVVQLRNGQGPCTAANAANVCQSGVCGSSGTCGFGTGDGPCTAQNGSTVCNGGVCGSAGVCIPQVAGGCWVDGDCDASQYCERSSSSCKAKRVAGNAIPNDGLHDGTCTPANAAATCVSGVCNASTNTCGVANGTACTAANQCESNRCSNGACIPSGPGACWVDAECSAGSYCHRATFACTAKVAAGAVIPNDGLHDGTCSVQTALAVCASGLCNAALNTCGVASGAACSAGAQCTSNVCAASGACVPTAGACFADTDCSGSQYCERNTFTCRAKLAAGSTIPNDGLHGGTCTQATALAVCAAGACNPATNTCGLALMAACQDSGECQSNHCSRSGFCVPQATSCYADPDCGQGQFCARSTYTCTAKLTPGAALPSDNLHQTCPAGSLNAACTTGRCNAAANTCAAVDSSVCTASAQCVSNACAASGRCVPTGGAGCWADLDCDGTQYCERASLTCRSDLADGAPIPSDGVRNGVCTSAVAAVVCASGACNATTNTCAGVVGRACAGPSECQFNSCQNGRCGIADGGSGCTQETAYLCQSGACSPGANTCVPASGGCFVDGDCPATAHCDRSTLKCAADKVAGVALPSDGLHDGVCTQALAEKVCVSGRCNAVTNTCASSNNAACVFAAECVANVCVANVCGTPNGSGPCTVATGALLCQSGRCNANADGAVSACIPQGTSSCWTDADCAGGSFCHRASFTCTPMLRAGAALPTDALHDSCVSGGFNAACASGRCNATTGTCAGANGAPCASANECVANACGSNGKCGLADGDGTCSAASATSLCQSGECSPQSALCTPNGGCWVDSDCDANEHCNRTAGRCAPDLDRSAPMPTDGIRSGTCDAAAAAAVCATGSCNAVANTCAAANGTACTSANQCVANVCGGNAKCGLADGQSGCTPGSTATCQSGACSAEGVCIPAGAGSCWVDGDCAAAEHCKRDSFTCVADKAAGEALPSDTLHVGVCSDVTAKAVCASGRCNAVTNTCAIVNGGTCALAKECVANVCGSNGKCGLAEGQGPCSESAATACQSGACSSSGVCMPAGKCWVDGDCAADQYCKRDTTTCTAKERVGSAIPNDGLHDGTCTEANAKATCASTLCNAATNTCAAEASSACTAANQCASGVCAADGSCGTPGGQECTSNSQCRSGNCVEGTCTIPGATLTGRGLLECAVGEATAPNAPSPWAFLLAGAAVLLRRRRSSGDEKTN